MAQPNHSVGITTALFSRHNQNGDTTDEQENIVHDDNGNVVDVERVESEQVTDGTVSPGDDDSRGAFGSPGAAEFMHVTTPLTVRR